MCACAPSEGCSFVAIDFQLSNQINGFNILAILKSTLSLYCNIQRHNVVYLF